MQQLSASQASPEVPINENFETLEHQAVYGKRHAATTGLTWAYYGGRWGGTSIADGTVTLTNAATNYLVVDRSTGTLSGSTSVTNWNNPSLYARVYKLTTAGSVVTATEDHRAGPYGVHGGEPGVRAVNSQSGAYTLVGTDAYSTVLHPSADTTARTFTIPANSAVAYRVGTELHFVNQNAAGTLTIAITSDTMRLAGAGTTGNRTLAANGVAIAKKVTSTEWIISGTGLT
jgi:hypothetical protein